MSSIDEVFSKLTGDGDKVLGARILSVETAQITVCRTFQYAWRVCRSRRDIQEQVHGFLVGAGVHPSVCIDADVKVQKDGVSREEADVPSKGAKVVHGDGELAP